MSNFELICLSPDGSGILLLLLLLFLDCARDDKAIKDTADSRFPASKNQMSFRLTFDF